MSRKWSRKVDQWSFAAVCSCFFGGSVAECGRMKSSLFSLWSRRNLLFVGAMVVSVFIPFLPLIIGYSGSAPAAPQAVAGIIDLRHWDFDRHGAVRLAGEWDFFPATLLNGKEASEASFPEKRKVPDFWKDDDTKKASATGCGTYRLRILLPPRADELALRYTTVSTAFRAYIDAEPVANAGIPGTDPSHSLPAYKPGVVRIPSSGNEMLLTVQVSNYEYRTGGMWRAFLIGTADRLETEKKGQDHLTFVYVGILVAMALQSIFIYFYRRSARNSLFFALFSIIVALRALVTGEYILVDTVSDISFDVLIRLEYVSAYLIIPLCIVYIFEELGFSEKRWFLFVNIPFVLLIPWAPLPILTRSITFYYPLAAAMILYTLFTLGRSLVRGGQGVRPIFIGFMIIASAGINDMLFSSFLVYTGNLLPAGLVVFTVIMNLSIAYRYSKAYKTIEGLLVEKDTYLKEIHHRVKNSLQIAASMMTLQANRIEHKDTAKLFLTMRDRIEAIALVHQKLYAAMPGNSVDVYGYVKDLIAHLAVSYGTGIPASAPEVVTGNKPLEVPIDFCVDFGLSLTELVINAYKHAGGPKQILVREEGGRVCATVIDGGPGYVEDALSGPKKSLGLKIVNSVVKRWGGEIHLYRGEYHGTKAEIWLVRPIPNIVRNGSA